MRVVQPVNTKRPITSSPDMASPLKPLELKVQSHPANLGPVRKAIEAYAAEQGFDEKSVAEIGLVVNEAMANVIRHAYDNRFDQPIHVTATMESANELKIGIRDWGKGVDPSKLPPKKRDPHTPGGVGLICLKQWMDQVVFTPQPDGGMLATMIRRK